LAGAHHWNTDNPHIHLIVRGKETDGRDLVIHREYITRGLRARARLHRTRVIDGQAIVRDRFTLPVATRQRPAR